GPAALEDVAAHAADEDAAAAAAYQRVDTAVADQEVSPRVAGEVVRPGAALDVLDVADAVGGPGRRPMNQVHRHRVPGREGRVIEPVAAQGGAAIDRQDRDPEAELEGVHAGAALELLDVLEAHRRRRRVKGQGAGVALLV